MLVSFIIELESLGDGHKDFRTFSKVMSVLRQSSIGGAHFEGVHHEQNLDDDCVVPFFGFNNTHQTRSPILPELKPEHGVRRYFGGYACMHGEGIPDLFGTYNVPLKPQTINGERVQLTATITLCGVHSKMPLLYNLSKLDES